MWLRCARFLAGWDSCPAVVYSALQRGPLQGLFDSIVQISFCEVMGSRGGNPTSHNKKLQDGLRGRISIRGQRHLGRSVRIFLFDLALVHFSPLPKHNEFQRGYVREAGCLNPLHDSLLQIARPLRVCLINIPFTAPIANQSASTWSAISTVPYPNQCAERGLRAPGTRPGDARGER